MKMKMNWTETRTGTPRIPWSVYQRFRMMVDHAASVVERTEMKGASRGMR